MTFFVALLLAGAPALKPHVDPDLAKMAGTWILQSINQGGTALDRDEFEGELIVKTDKSVIMRVTFYNVQPPMAQSTEYIVDLSSGHDPKQMDALLNNGQTLKGIYRLEDDTLTRSFALPNAARPKTFKAQNGETVTVLKRKK